MCIRDRNYIRLIRNATLKMEYAGKQILVDPLLGAKGSFGSALGVNPNPRVNLTMPVEEVLDGLDFTLLTHNHPDHYDETDRKIPTNHPCPSRNRKVSGAH